MIVPFGAAREGLCTVLVAAGVGVLRSVDAVVQQLGSLVDVDVIGLALDQAEQRVGVRSEPLEPTMGSSSGAGSPGVAHLSGRR